MRNRLESIHRQRHLVLLPNQQRQPDRQQSHALQLGQYSKHSSERERQTPLFPAHTQQCDSKPHGLLRLLHQFHSKR